MIVNRQLLTDAGYKTLKEELSYLKGKGLELANSKVRECRSFCDYNEDPEYKKSVDELATLKKKIIDLEDILEQAQIINGKNTLEVQVGSFLTVKEVSEDGHENEIQFKIVSVAESHLSKNYISDESPVGKKLIGHKLNECVKIKTPSGMMQLLITEIKNGD